jgi:hypothetical protein
MALASQGTLLKIGTGSGGAKTVSGITVGNPTIITSTAHGLSNGDVVTMSLFTGADAGDINAESFVVLFTTTNTFAIKLDTLGKTISDNSAAARATPVEWTTVGEVVDGDRAAGERTEIDTTHLASDAKEYLLGLKDSGNYNFNMNWLFDDLGQDALLEAESSDDAYDFKVEYPSGNSMTFEGLVKGVTGPSLGVDDKMSGSVSIRITGEVTFA